ncbi:MAG TPA: hypothetical protein VF290_01870 [Pyrinomonadaceae bacterium]
MNSPNNKRPGAIRIQQSFTHQRQLKPPVAQLKKVSASPIVRHPVAPPVYRPQAKPQVMQQKTVGSHFVKTHPSAPPVYRPQPISKALQAKMVGNQHPHQKPLVHKVVAPPVYRPQQKQIVQPKVGATAQTRMPAKPPQTQAARGRSIQPSLRTNVPPQARFRQQISAAQSRQNPAAPPSLQLRVAQAKSVSMFSTRMGRQYVVQGAKVIQAKWIAADDGNEKWDAPLDGVTWYADANGGMWFDVTHEDQIRKGNKQDYLSMAGKQNKRTWEEWAQAGAPIHDEVSAMLELTDAQMEWGPASYKTTPSAFRAQQPFYLWLFENQGEPTKMNCWEAVLYSAFKAGVKDKSYIKKAIVIEKANGEFTFGAIRFVRAILKAPTKQIKKKPSEDMVQLPDEAIPRGHVVLFGEDGQHVALSTGTLVMGEHGVLELDKLTGGVVASTVEEVMRRNSPYRSLVSWGPFPVL